MTLAHIFEPIRDDLEQVEREFARHVEGFAAKMTLEGLYERTGIQILPFDTLFQLYAAARDEPGTLRSARLSGATKPTSPRGLPAVGFDLVVEALGQQLVATVALLIET